MDENRFTTREGVVLAAMPRDKDCLYKEPCPGCWWATRRTKCMVDTREPGEAHCSSLGRKDKCEIYWAELVVEVEPNPL